jgi:hypothetical protein
MPRANKNGAGSKIRTRDPLITNQVLYQLSYTGGSPSMATAHADTGMQHKVQALVCLYAALL